MTDEEMAKEYAKLNARQYIHNDGIGFCTSEEEVRQAYLAGLKAGRLKWHFVKDRLPEELHDVLCFVIHNEHRFVLQGYLRDGRWVLSPLGTYLNNDEVIAWCEIPTFTDKEQGYGRYMKQWRKSKE